MPSTRIVGRAASSRRDRAVAAPLIERDHRATTSAASAIADARRAARQARSTIAAQVDRNRHQHERHRQQQVVGRDARLDHAEPQHPADPESVQRRARPAATRRRRQPRARPDPPAPAAASAASSARCARTCRADSASLRPAPLHERARQRRAVGRARDRIRRRSSPRSTARRPRSSQARFGATIHAITITTSGIMNWRSPGRSNRLMTCHRKNRRTIVSPLVGAR